MKDSMRKRRMREKGKYKSARVDEKKSKRGNSRGKTTYERESKKGRCDREKKSLKLFLQTYASVRKRERRTICDAGKHEAGGKKTGERGDGPPKVHFFPRTRR